MNYQTSSTGELLHTGDPPKQQSVAIIKHGSNFIHIDHVSIKSVKLISFYSFKELSAAISNSSFD
ncbi:MAG: hypothetical protein AB7S48_01265 [Bacteroidales bacterium]